MKETRKSRAFIMKKSFFILNFDVKFIILSIYYGYNIY